MCSQAIAAREELPPALQRLEHRAFHALVAPPHDEEVVPAPLFVPTIGHLAVETNLVVIVPKVAVHRDLDGPKAVESVILETASSTVPEA